MGSIRSEDESNDRMLNVLVTGFGPFGSNQVNPSYLIVNRLPTEQEVSDHHSVKIHAYPSPLTVAYKSIRKCIPKLLFSDSPDDAPPNPNNFYKQSSNTNLIKKTPTEGHANFDMVLHIGMAPGCGFYTLETWAHRDGYKRGDVNHETMEDDTLWKQKYGAPSRLQTSFNTQDVLQRWKKELSNEEDLRLSTDAGHYLCDFIYYTSLAEYWHRSPKGARPVVFLHVPGGFDDEDIERGVAVTVGLIKALVGSLGGRKGS